ncbi:MAG: hypothetical protein NTU58_02070 [Candidatus Nealsonbacteria bacterium]|nr:hypothetical protein [Candidatus Nealsonbacteria bacterium]
MKKRKKIKKTKLEALRKLLEDPDVREMIKKTDSFGGHLVNGDKQCTI